LTTSTLIDAAPNNYLSVSLVAQFLFLPDFAFIVADWR